MSNLFAQLSSSPVLASCILAYMLSQPIKGIIQFIKERKFSLHTTLFGTGGMPSSHSAFVSALFGSVYITEGISTGFAIALAFGLVTLRDAVGVRMAAGNQAKVLNAIIEKQRLNFQPLNVSLGHKPKEVVAGIATGLFAVVLVFIWY